MKKIFLPLLFTFSLNSMADNAVIKFRHDNPDMVFQMRFNEDNRNFVIDQARQAIKVTQGIDIFDHTIEYPEFPSVTTDITLEDYLDKHMARLVRDSINFKLKQIITTVDIYKLSYKVGQPVFTLKSQSTSEDSIDLTLAFSFRNLEVDVENLYINNHSPGVTVTRRPDLGGRNVVTGKEHMTLIDDIYLKIQSPEDRPLVAIETNADEPAVISGEIRIRVNKNSENGMSLEYQSHDFAIFDSKDAELLKDKIKVYIGRDSRIGGLDAIEFGRSELRIAGNVNDLINKKRAFLLNLVAEPLVAEVEGPAVTQLIKDNINNVKVSGPKNLTITGLDKSQTLIMDTEINSVGILHNDDSEQQQLHLSTNNAISWLNNAFQEPEALPFPLTDSSNHQKSLDLITSEIKSGSSDIIVSLGQDYINHLIYNITKGHLELPNDPSTKKDDIIKNGKKGIFLILEDQANQGKVVVDILVKPNFFLSLGMAIATFRSKLYFPLILIPEIVVEMKNNIPNLVIKIKDIEMSEETLRKGLHGVTSNLNKGINRKLVIKKIKEQLSPMIGSTLKSLPITHLEGLNLNSVSSLSSDRMGRLNLKINLRKGTEEGKTLAQLLPKTLKKLLVKKS
jgi:hypothetical protein